MTTVSTELSRYKMFIGGRRVDAVSGESFESLNPYTGKAWAAIPDGREEDVDLAVAAAGAALVEGNPWKEPKGTIFCLMLS